jgi:hypothetical protein
MPLAITAIAFLATDYQQYLKWQHYVDESQCSKIVRLYSILMIKLHHIQNLIIKQLNSKSDTIYYSKINTEVINRHHKTKKCYNK